VDTAYLQVLVLRRALLQPGGTPLQPEHAGRVPQPLRPHLLPAHAAQFWIRAAADIERSMAGAGNKCFPRAAHAGSLVGLCMAA